jgi:hypothetical protein
MGTPIAPSPFTLMPMAWIDGCQLAAQAIASFDLLDT